MTKNSSKVTINANFVNNTVKCRFSGDKTAPLALSFHRTWAAILDDFENFRSRPKSSSETQGQIKGARESLNGRKNIYGTKKSTFLRATFFRPFRLSLVSTICPWVSEDVPKSARIGSPFLGCPFERYDLQRSHVNQSLILVLRIY